MKAVHREFRDCVGCPCFLKSCTVVIRVGDVDVKVYDVCCHSCSSGYPKLLDLCYEGLIHHSHDVVKKRDQRAKAT